MRDTANRWAICSGLMFCSSILLDVLSPTTSSAATCEPPIAKAMAVEGKVDVRSTDSTQWRPVKLNDTFCPGDVIRVQERSRADIALSNQPMLRLDQNSTMTLGGVKKQGGSVVELTKGAMHFFSRLPRNLDIKTAFVNAGVEGTEGVVNVGDENAEVTIFEGKVVASNESGAVTITNGQSVVAETNKPLTYQTVVKPRDAVQWALHYPPVIDRRAGDAGEVQSLTNRAADALAVGRVDEAKADLDRALTTDPRSADALALQSIIAVVQNDKQQALGLATSAVAANPQSASAKIALSYAQQAHFDVEGALKSLQEAVKAEPNNALAWSRLAEMHLSLQQLDKGLAAAQKAVELNPKVERAHTVLGFAYLLQVKTKEAQAEFQTAHEIDQAAALPQLGLGLAKFREGKVEEGRREMEVAASLDPNNSLIRSYLGKAYFEEKRDKLTEREYATAKELDSKDPTPFFYDALQKQLTNRPIEAMKDMEQAIALNKNRAVYRSQLQMDSDVAARSSSLARIYTNLGFQELALVEGWTSVATDDSSFTAHRFLADTYAALPRHEVARVSELFRSQMLQPLNVTPIQPSLAESNLFLLSALGPSALSFNEFNTLMVNRDRVTLQANGLVGTQNTFAGEAIVSGIYNKFSFSGGWSNFDTDGWRINADQKDRIGNAFLQYQVTPQTMIQAEFRHRKTQYGDLQLNFFRADVDPTLRHEIERDTYRVGGRHELSPNSMLLGSFMYQTRDDQDRADSDAGGGDTVHFDNRTPGQKSYGGELQHIFRSKYVNVTSGFGHFDFSREQSTVLDLILAGGGGTNNLVNERANLSAKHTNAYMYTSINPLRNLSFTLGVSGDFYNSKNVAQAPDKNQINPKFGMIWNPFPGTTVRAAAFRTLTRALITSQTLEPTQVAGFNQFYDDFESTEAWRYGAAVNQKFSRTVFGGVEYAQRDIDTPLSVPTGTGGLTAVSQDWHEKVGRTYLFWTPHDWVSLTAEYRYERFIRNEFLNLGFRNVETHRIPLGLNVFHPSGLSLSIRPTYIHQQGSFQSRNTDCCQSGKDSFWIVDAGLSYRLPKRYGIVTVGARNLFNEDFLFQETDIRNQTVSPKRLVFAQLTIALP